MTRVTEQVEECWFYFVGAEPELSYFLLHFNWIAEFDLGNIGRGFFFLVWEVQISALQPLDGLSTETPPVTSSDPSWPLTVLFEVFLYSLSNSCRVSDEQRACWRLTKLLRSHLLPAMRSWELLPNILQMAKRGQSVTVFCTSVDLWKQRLLSFIIKSGHSLEVVAGFFTSNYKLFFSNTFFSSLKQLFLWEVSLFYLNTKSTTWLELNKLTLVLLF